VLAKTSKKLTELLICDRIKSGVGSGFAGDTGAEEYNIMTHRRKKIKFVFPPHQAALYSASSHDPTSRHKGVRDASTALRIFLPLHKNTTTPNSTVYTYW